MQATVWFADLSAPPGRSLIDKTGDLLRAAVANGFAFAVVGAPLLIADGIRGESSVSVPVEGKIFSEVAIGADIVNADAIVAVAHCRGPELSGFGGTIKNLGMGCAARSGKLAQHSSVSPFVDPAGCTGCGTCVAHCPSGAIEILSPTALIDPRTCIGCADCIVVCPEHTVKIDWNEAAPTVQKKMVEHAAGALRGKKEASLFLSFVMQISPYCDCYGNNDRPIAPDVGILASAAPVALDQACADLVIRSAGRDPFRETHPEIDWTIQLSYAEELGLGTREYLLEPLGRGIRCFSPGSTSGRSPPTSSSSTRREGWPARRSARQVPPRRKHGAARCPCPLP